MRTVILVTGPPCAGKTSYVQARVKPGDIVLDQDVIGPKAMRLGLAKVARMAHGTAWVIRCCPGAKRRQALAAQLHATDVVHLRPNTSQLLARAARRANRASAEAAVREWLRQEDRNRQAAPRQPAKQASKSPSRPHSGRPYRRARAQMFAIYGTTCHLCGHGGAGEADHLVPLAVDATQPLDPHTMRPAHGIKSRCPVCPGRPACNQSRSDRPLTSMFRPTLAW